MNNQLGMLPALIFGSKIKSRVGGDLHRNWVWLCRVWMTERNYIPAQKAIFLLPVQVRKRGWYFLSERMKGKIQYCSDYMKERKKKWDFIERLSYINSFILMDFLNESFFFFWWSLKGYPPKSRLLLCQPWVPIFTLNKLGYNLYLKRKICRAWASLSKQDFFWWM